MQVAPTIDCLVIGGGPAGLTAAVYLGRFLRSVTVIDKGWSRAAWITSTHNLPGFPQGIAGPAFLEALRAQASEYGAVLRAGVVESLVYEGERFTARVGDVQIVARTVLLATGVVENKPPLAHVAEWVKRGVIRTCPICDGYECIGKRVAVFGSGDHAGAEAQFLRTYTDRLMVLLAAGDANILSGDMRSALDLAGVEVRTVAERAVAVDEHGVAAVTVEDGQVHHFDKVYSAFGVTSQGQLARDLGARLDEAGRLYVSEHQETSLAGLYAAGDLVRGLNQISVACGEAAVAATAIHNRLPKVFA